MNHIDERISNLLRESANDFSDEINPLVDKTLERLPKHPKNKKIWRMGVAALVFLSLIASSFHPTVSRALQDIPFIGQIFHEVGDKGLERASQKGLTTPLSLSATDNGVRIELTEMVRDGTRFSIGYTETHNQPINLDEEHQEGTWDLNLNAGWLFINGERPLGYSFGGIPTKQISSNQIAGVIELELLEQDLSNTESIEFALARSRKFPGTWVFKLDEFPTIADAKRVKINQTYPIDDRFSLKINEIHVSSATIGVDYEFIDKENANHMEEGYYYSFDGFYNLDRVQYDWLAGSSTRLIPNGNDQGLILPIVKSTRYWEKVDGKLTFVHRSEKNKIVKEIKIRYSDYE